MPDLEPPAMEVHVGLDQTRPHGLSTSQHSEVVTRPMGDDEG